MRFFGPNIEKLEDRGDREGLIKELDNKKTDTRIKAVKSLARLKSIKGLKEALSNDEVDVRINAIEAFSDADKPEVVEVLIDHLISETTEEVLQKNFKALNNFDLGIDDWTNIGKKLLETEEPEKALKCFDKAIEMVPVDDPSYPRKEMIGYVSGILLDYQKNQDALRYAEQLIDMDPEDDRGWTLKARCLKNLGEQEAALKFTKKALEINPENIGARHDTAIIHFEKEEYEKVISLCRETLELDPSHIRNRYLLSDALALTNKLSDAEEVIKNALDEVYSEESAEAEDLAALYQQLGIITVMRGHEGALEYFEKAIKADQQNQWSYKLADSYVIQEMVGSNLREGTPQDRRAHLIGFAGQRATKYTSYAEWKRESGT